MEEVRALYIIPLHSNRVPPTLMSMTMVGKRVCEVVSVPLERKIYKRHKKPHPLEEVTLFCV